MGKMVSLRLTHKSFEKVILHQEKNFSRIKQYRLVLVFAMFYSYT
jgi:hypothetical protein